MTSKEGVAELTIYHLWHGKARRACANLGHGKHPRKRCAAMVQNNYPQHVPRSGTTIQAYQNVKSQWIIIMAFCGTVLYLSLYHGCAPLARVLAMA